jgi:hypothetical protein
MNETGQDDLPRKLPAAAGLRWVIDGFGLYRKNPLLFSTAFGAMFGVVMALGFIPAIGASLSEFAMPVMIAGFLAAYRVLDEGREPDAQSFLAGVRGPLMPLVTLGAVQLLATVLIGQAMLAMGLDPVAIRAAAESGKSPAEMQALLNQALPAALLGLVLFAPLMMATLFAPALVLFGGARPATALAVSLKASWRNLPALFVNGMVLGALFVVALLIPLLLGLLLAMPILLGSLYAAYQAVFAVWSDERARTAGQ